MSRFLIGSVCLALLLAGLAGSPAKTEASGTYSRLTMAAVTGGLGYRSTSGTGGGLSPNAWDLKTDTGTVSTTVTEFYWSSTTIYFTVDQCVFEAGKDLAGLMVIGFTFPVEPADRQDCYSYQVPYDSNAQPINTLGAGGTIGVEIFWPAALYDVRLNLPIKMPAPVNVNLDSPVLLEGSGSSTYEVPFSWDYFAWTGASHRYWYEVEWNGTVYPVGQDLGAFRSFSESGPVAARVRAATICTGSVTVCNPTVDGVAYTRYGSQRVLLGKWSRLQTVMIPIADEQYPTRVIEPEEAPPAIVDALGAVFGAIGVQDPDAKAHLWSIFICLLLAIGLAATCFGYTGGGPASVFLGAVAFFLVFSLAGPPAFGVPGVFAGLALLVPSLGLVVFAKTKVK